MYTPWFLAHLPYALRVHRSCGEVNVAEFGSSVLDRIINGAEGELATGDVGNWNP